MLHIARRVRAYAEEISAMCAHSRQPVLSVALRALWFRARYGLGPKYFADQGFLSRPIRQHRDYLTSREQMARQTASAPERFRHLEEDRLVFHARCAALGVPSCPTLAAIVLRGERREEGVPEARSPEELQTVLESLGDRDVILRRVDGGLGYGVHRMFIRNGVPSPDPDTLEPPLGDATAPPPPDFHDAPTLFHWLQSLPFQSERWILQPHLRPHPELLPVMPGPGLGTVRIHTFLMRSGEVRLRWPLLKIPGTTSIIDNFRDGKGNTVAAPMDLDTGRLLFAVGRRGPKHPLEEMDRHPVLGTPLTGFQVPLWSEVKDMVTRAAPGIPELPALGWDVAITPDGPMALEANWEFGAWDLQLLLRRGIKQEFHALFDDLAEPRPWEPHEP